MATKIGNRRQQRAARGGDAEQTENELEVLHPERYLVLRGAKVTVREYGHVEWLRLLPAAAPLIDAITGMLEEGTAPVYEDVLGVLAEHIDGLLPLVRQAADMSVEAFEALNPDDGELLLMTWWGCNGRFFVQRAVTRLTVRSAEEARKGASLRATGKSTQPSSPTATPEPTSAATPSDS